MKKNKIYSVLSSLLICVMVSAQDKKEMNAEAVYNDYKYAEAIDLYEQLVELGYNSETVYTRLANSNYLNARYQNAAKWYQKLFEMEDATPNPEEVYKYALTLKSIGEYDKSDEWMRKFEALKKDDKRAHLFEKNKDYLKKIKENSGRHTIIPTGINSEGSDFSPSFYGEKLVFSSTRNTNLAINIVDEWNNKSFLNLFKADVSENGSLSNPLKLSKNLNKKTHESSSVFTKDGKTMYFTRNNSKNGRFVRDKDGVSRLKLFRATNIDGEWTDIIELPFNSDDYSIAHPTLNKNEDKLYFASDMPSSRGKSDIYVVSINADGSHGEPRNLGSNINTEGRETFPFVTDNDVLYFASDGHPGLGGLDIFATKISDMTNIYIQNVGEPVNSKEDDFSFIFNENTNKGYFASNREGGKGSDDIYSFVENKDLDLDCNTLVAGNVINEKTGLSLAGAKIALRDSNNALISETISDENGSFILEGSCKKGQYKLVAQKDGFTNGDGSFAVLDAKNTNGLVLKLMPIKQAAPIGTDLTKYLNLEPIYFDFDKSSIRIDGQITMQKVFAYLNEFPEVHIEVRSHTDSRAGDHYNQILSEKRAQETVTYLLANGINSPRLSSNGFGESQLINKCSNGVPCSEADHQLNRRSEFIVVKN